MLILYHVALNTIGIAGRGRGKHAILVAGGVVAIRRARLAGNVIVSLGDVIEGAGATDGIAIARVAIAEIAGIRTAAVLSGGKLVQNRIGIALPGAHLPIGKRLLSFDF